jgi:hypothetical protein
MPSARVLVLVTLVVSAVGRPLGAADLPEPPASRHQIDTWVRELGHPDYRVRDAAARELTRRPEARPAVRTAAQSAGDPEVRGRAGDILHAYYRIDRPKVLARLRGMAAHREADLLAETAVRYLGDEDPVWQALTDFGWGGLDAVRDASGRLAFAERSYLPDRDFAKYKASREPEILFPQAGWAAAGTYLFRGARLVLDRRAAAPLAAVTGPIDARGASGCFWVANADVTLSGSVTESVIVCDADIEARAAGRPRWTYLRSSLLVARGNIRLPLRVSDCVILAAGNVDIPEGATLRATTIRAGGKIIRPDDWFEEEVELIEDRRGGATRPFVFFEPARVGLAVTTVAGGVTAARLDPNSPLAVAGLRVGDAISAVDGSRIDSVEGLRQKLRSAYIAGEGTVTVRRDNADHVLAVRFSD